MNYTLIVGVVLLALVTLFIGFLTINNTQIGASLAETDHEILAMVLNIQDQHNMIMELVRQTHEEVGR